MNNEQDHLLIVDDIEANRDLLSRCLEDRGYCVTLAENGKQALELLAQREFDLVLLDIELPEMSGLKVLELLRRTRAPIELPVIMVTAYGGDGGEFAFDCLAGSMHGACSGNVVEFSWNGNDEMEPASGEGCAELQDDGSLRGEISLQGGDDIPFIARRVTTSSTAC